MFYSFDGLKSRKLRSLVGLLGFFYLEKRGHNSSRALWTALNGRSSQQLKPMSAVGSGFALVFLTLDAHK